MKIALLIVALTSIAIPASAQISEIDSLEFSYATNYAFIHSGYTRTYDIEGRLTSEVEKVLEYRVVSHDSTNGNRVLSITSRRDTSVSREFLSNVRIDKNGMFWWDEDTKEEVPAIKLPLYKGRKWKGWFYNHKALFECTAPDTLINTPLGERRVFIITSTLTTDKTRGYKRVIKRVEAYDQTFGKVMYLRITYLDFKGERPSQILGTELMTISDAILPVEYVR